MDTTPIDYQMRYPVGDGLRRRDITEDQRIIILLGLIGCNTGVGATRWIKVVLPNIGCSDRQAEEKSLNSDHINRINYRVVVCIGCIASASEGKWHKVKEMTLSGDYIDGVDLR